MNDQYIIPLFVAGSLLLTLFAFFLIAYLLVQKNKQNAYQLEKRQMIFDHQNSILRTKIEENEQTMAEISKELHDNIKSVLGTAQMSMLRMAELATDEKQAALANNTSTMIDGVIENVRNLSHSLNGNFLKNMGLVETISKELENVRLARDIVCEIDIKGNQVPLDPEKEVHIFRIAQEAIQNSLKHAKATRLIFVVQYSANQFIMKISDNGAGFDKNKIYELKGIGFLNMLQRAKYVHGLLEVESVPTQGSSIILTLDLSKDGSNN